MQRTTTLGKQSQIKGRLLQTVDAFMCARFESDGFGVSEETKRCALMEAVEYGYDAMATNEAYADRPGFAGVQKERIRSLGDNEHRFLRHQKLLLYGALFTYYDLLIAMLWGGDRREDERLMLTLIK